MDVLNVEYIDEEDSDEGVRRRGSSDAVLRMHHHSVKKAEQQQQQQPADRAHEYPGEAEDEDSSSDTDVQERLHAKAQRGKPRVVSARQHRSTRYLGGAETPENWLMQGHLRKGEFRAPTACGCLPLRDRRFKSKFVALDLGSSALVYATSRGAVMGVAARRVPLLDIRTVALESDGSSQFRVFLKKPAQERYHGRPYFTWRAVDHNTAEEWVRNLRDVIFLRATVYSVGPLGTFPEAELGVIPTTALCFSGGGARAHSACAGQLRALHTLRLLNDRDVSYISSVSGSAWATAIYTFYEEGAADDEELLGQRSSMDKLDMDSLRETVCPLIRPATVDLWKMAESLWWSSDSHEWWERSVGEVYLAPFGLNDDKSFGHPAMAAVLAQQKHHMGQIRLARKGRPFWVANAAVVGPSWARSGDLFPVQFTPLYSGTPFSHHMNLRGLRRKSMRQSVQVGGAMIDTFAFGSDVPTTDSMAGHKGSLVGGGRKLSLPEGVKAISNAASDLVMDVFRGLETLVKDHREDSHQGVSKRAVRVPIPERPLTLRHAVGIASHAPAFIFKNSRFMERLNPRNKYWTPAFEHVREDGTTHVHAGASEAHEMDFADGGTLDNVGLLSMIQRRVKRVVVFINSEIAVPMEPKRRRPGNAASARQSANMRKSVRKVLRSSRRDLTAPPLQGLHNDFAQMDDDEANSVVVEEFSEGLTFMPEYEDWPQASILPLFGVEVPIKGEYGTFAHNQVFRKPLIMDLLEQFQRAKINDEPLIAVDRYEVLRNDWWGIPGGYEVTVMWVYLEKVRSFELQLPRETREQIDKGKRGAFPRFPLYRTFGQKKGKWIEPALEVEQANLLAAQCEWTIMQNAPTFKHFLRDAEKAVQQEGKMLTSELEEAGFA